MADTQISAHISQKTKELMERYADAHGVKKGALIEQALLHHLRALRELPADIIIPPLVELSAASFAEVANVVSKPRQPTKRLRSIMADRPARDPGER